ncbi:MAG: TIGR00296 family protein [Candidatus Micrarchaeia archaeon]|jgi:hypothetical protein
MVSESNSSYLIELARKSIFEYLENNKKIEPIKEDKELKEEKGVFVTIKSFPDDELRGQVGYPYPMGEIDKNIIDNAISAALHDPRFPHIKKEELNNIIIEISILSRPELIKVSSPEEYPSKIKVGKDGLIIKYGSTSGVLLPQIPIEWNWNAKEFLCNTCEKAGLPKDMWNRPTVEIYKFQADVYKETEPNGKIVKNHFYR